MGVYSWLKSKVGLPDWVKRRFAGEVGEQNVKLAEGIVQQQAIINGMNLAIGQAYQRAQSEHYEKLVFLGALALQSGGKIVLPRTFIDAITEGDYRVQIGPGEDNTLVITLKNPAEEQSEPEEEACECGEGGCGTCE